MRTPRVSLFPMRSWAVYGCLLLAGVATIAGALSACATGTEQDGGVAFGTHPQQGGGSSGGDDATTSSSSGMSSSGGSSSGYGDDTSSMPDMGMGTPDTGDDGGGITPGPTCVPGQTCVDAVPSGWTGFVQLLVQAGDAGTACPAPYGVAQPQLGGQTDPQGGPATCGSCSCVVPDAGVTCSIGVGYDDALCTSGGNPKTVPQNQCTALGGFFGGNGFVAAAPTTSGGSCVAQGGQVITPGPTPTSTPALPCATPEAGAPAGDAGSAGSMTCMSNQACAVVPGGGEAGSPSGVCIHQSGVQDCPSGTAFSVQHVVGALEDDRGCGCSCGTPSCPADGYVTGFTNSGCTGAPTVTLDAGSPCKQGGTKPTYAYYHPSRSGSLGSCALLDGGPTGTVTIDGGTATTFCCIP